MSWPARAYVYGTWEYAVAQAYARAADVHLRMFVYKAVLDDEVVWVASWDPKNGVAKRMRNGN